MLPTWQRLSKTREQWPSNTVLLHIFPFTPPGTTSPLSEQTPIRGDKKLADLIDELERDSQSVSIDYDHPLVVVAPAPAPQGTQLSGSLFFMVEFIQIVLLICFLIAEFSIFTILPLLSPDLFNLSLLTLHLPLCESFGRRESAFLGSYSRLLTNGPTVLQTPSSR